ncbi:MAG TPA: M48 family metallopeptidase [Xanthobacteraceae bacterium]|nr:M48 family metallopeptidase [Xanthobacteraceae bacterium]
MWHRVASALLAGGLVASCAGPSMQTPGVSSEEIAAEQQRQQYFQIQTFNAQAARLENVAFKIKTANAADCAGNIVPQLGFRAIDQRDVSESKRAIEAAALQLDPDRPTVVSVVQGGPAVRAGMQVGDVVQRVDGHLAPKEEWPSWLNNYVKTVGATRPVAIEVSRQGQTKMLSATPVFACNIPVELVEDTQINAYTDSKKIVLYTGIMRVAQNDTELAAVVGHELAHVTLGHLAKRQQNQIVGGAAGFVADVAVAMAGVNTGGAFMKSGANMGLAAYATQFEREADYVGAYYAVRAGFPGSAERFWRAMAQENPKEIFFAGLHPTSPERFLQMQKTYAEIDEKVRLHQPLVPEKRVVVAEPVKHEDE